MTNQELANRILVGLPRDEVKELFALTRGKNLHAGARGRLTIELESILTMLPDVITADQADALRSLALEEIRPCDLYDWLSGRLATTWKESLRNLREAEIRQMARGFFPWEDVDACRLDAERQRLQAEAYKKRDLEIKLCPACQKSAQWVWFESPPWTWQKLCGRAGWLAVCDECHLQIAFHLVLMN